ncbi:MAG: hypothetical protein LVQ96_08755 [Thermoplasmatales archaeon]|nr:hypothetical protein [Thermoplasmatales archaeon]MCW6171238.1 hypothetical protein [Thermoplasmatales archaeon]
MDKLTNIRVTRVCDCDIDIIFGKISKWEDLPLYWYGMRNITKQDDDTFLVKFAFPGKSRMKYIVNGEAKSCREIYLSGAFRGFKEIKIEKDPSSKTRINVVWEIELSAALRMMRERMVQHLTLGTEHALERIIEAAGRLSPQENQLSTE